MRELALSGKVWTSLWRIFVVTTCNKAWRLNSSRLKTSKKSTELFSWQSLISHYSTWRNTWTSIWIVSLGSWMSARWRLSNWQSTRRCSSLITSMEAVIYLRWSLWTAPLAMDTLWKHLVCTIRHIKSLIKQTKKLLKWQMLKVSWLDKAWGKKISKGSSTYLNITTWEGWSTQRWVFKQGKSLKKMTQVLACLMSIKRRFTCAWVCLSSLIMTSIYRFWASEQSYRHRIAIHRLASLWMVIFSCQKRKESPH